MTHWRFTGVCLSIVLIFAAYGAIAAEGDQLLAMIGKPAVVTIAPAAGSKNESRDSGRFVLKVAGFKPPQDGSSVQAVVKVQKTDGSEQEVHRFAVFPQKEFKERDASKFRKFGFSLPKELASGTVQLKVELVPLRGKGEGARLEIGSVERAHVR